MTANPFSSDKLTKLIDEFFKEFKGESLIWTGYLWNIRIRSTEKNYLDVLNKYHSFESLTSLLKEDFFRRGIEEFEDFLKECRESKTGYILNKDINFLKDQDRLCWFIINDIEDKYPRIKESKYDYKHAYFSLLFLIHVKLNYNQIKLEDIRKSLNILNSKKNSLDLLKNYVNNNNFIEWGIKYTQKKYKIKTRPSFEPLNNEERLFKLLGYWDFEFLKHKYRYEVEIGALKKAWQQKQFRDKGGLKKPYHLPLTKKTKSQLEQLAEKMNISETKTLEKLIENAYKNEMLDEKGKACY